MVSLKKTEIKEFIKKVKGTPIYFTGWAASGEPGLRDATYFVPNGEYNELSGIFRGYLYDNTGKQEASFWIQSGFQGNIYGYKWKFHVEALKQIKLKDNLKVWLK